MPTPTESKVIMQAREAQGLSLRDFAGQLGVSHNAVAQWENGKAEVDLDRVSEWLSDNRDWVRVLGVTLLGCKFAPAFNKVMQKYGEPIGSE